MERFFTVWCIFLQRVIFYALGKPQRAGLVALSSKPASMFAAWVSAAGRRTDGAAGRHRGALGLLGCMNQVEKTYPSEAAEPTG